MYARRVAFLFSRCHTRPGVRGDERDLRAPARRFDHDPPALTVSEQAHWCADERVRDESADTRKRVIRLLDDRGLLPAAGRPANAALVERRDCDTRFEEVGPNRWEVHVVVSIGRT